MGYKSKILNTVTQCMNAIQQCSQITISQCADNTVMHNNCRCIFTKSWLDCPNTIAHKCGDDFSAGAWGSKNCWKTIKTIKFKICLMQYVFFPKKRYILCTIRCGAMVKAPEAGEFSRIFVLKITLFLPRDASAERGYEIACRPSVRPSVRPWRLGTVIT